MPCEPGGLQGVAADALGDTSRGAKEDRPDADTRLRSCHGRRIPERSGRTGRGGAGPGKLYPVSLSPRLA
eukprot:10853-Hanusia_phi.AAC.2